jgi:hypothetical protein
LPGATAESHSTALSVITPCNSSDSVRGCNLSTAWVGQQAPRHLVYLTSVMLISDREYDGALQPMFHRWPANARALDLVSHAPRWCTANKIIRMMTSISFRHHSVLSWSGSRHMKGSSACMGAEGIGHQTNIGIIVAAKQSTGWDT